MAVRERLLWDGSPKLLAFPIQLCARKSTLWSKHPPARVLPSQLDGLSLLARNLDIWDEGILTRNAPLDWPVVYLPD